MYNKSYHQFIQDKKRKEREEMESRYRQEEAQLKAEYQEYLKIEEEKRKAEREAMFGKNPNVRELRVVDNVPIIFTTDDFSQVVDMKIVKDVTQLTHQQRSELHALEPRVFGRLMSGLTNFQTDEEFLSRAFSMRLEEFDTMTGIFEKGKKLNYSKQFIDQQLECYSMEELDSMMTTALKK